MNHKKWVCAIVLVLTTPVASRAGTNDLGAESFTIMGFTNRVEEDVYVVRGTMVDANPYNWERDGTWSTYEVTESAAADAPTGVIYVGYAKTSVRDPLPAQALLIVVPTGVNRFYHALGEEAWRGVYSDTAENRSRFWGLTAEEAVARTRGPAITAAEAWRIALADLVAQHREIVGRKVMANRGPFGWTVHVWVRQSSEGTLARPLFVEVRDEGYVFDVVSGGMPLDVDAILEGESDTNRPPELRDTTVP